MCVYFFKIFTVKTRPIATKIMVFCYISTTIWKSTIFTDCLNAVRVFGGIGVVSGFVVTCLLFIFVKKPDSRRCLALSSVTLCFVSGKSKL